MVNYAISPKGVRRGRTYLSLRLRQISRGQVNVWKEKLKPFTSPVSILAEGALVDAKLRGTSAMAVSFDHRSTDIRVLASQQMLTGVRPEFLSDTPPVLMGRALDQRESVHIQKLGTLDRRSIACRRRESGGMQALSAANANVQLVTDDFTTEIHYPSRNVTGVLPIGFRETQGAVLLTPIGIERATTHGFGFIWEYQATGPFSPADIQTSRVFSALLTTRFMEAVG